MDEDLSYCRFADRDFRHGPERVKAHAYSTPLGACRRPGFGGSSKETELPEPCLGIKEEEMVIYNGDVVGDLVLRQGDEASKTHQRQR
jgi:hypothetical protein